MPTVELACFSEDRPAALVVSHQRSGTHFLMNTLASCFGYVSRPWINLDPITTPLNYYDPSVVRQYLDMLADQPLANVIKSHHMADCFEGELPRLAERYVVLYICRDPVAVLLSHWRFAHRFAAEGPQTDDPLAFARAEPCTGVLRYQKRQYPDMMRRWAAHVEGWLAAAETNPGVAVVRYEDLDQHFEETVHDLGEMLERPPQSLTRPPTDVNVVPGGPEDPTGLGRPPDKEALRRLCRETVGATMERLGY